MKRSTSICRVFIIGLLLLVWMGSVSVVLADSQNMWDQLNENEKKQVLEKLKTELPALMEDGPYERIC